MKILLQTLAAGATSFINKRASAPSLRHALLMVSSGCLHVLPSVLKARGLYNPARKAAATKDIDWLPRPQTNARQLPAAMLQGRDSRAVAASLHISEAAVRAEQSRLLKTLGVTNQAEAILVFAAAANIQ